MLNDDEDDLMMISIDQTSSNRKELAMLAASYQQILIPELDLVEFPKKKLLAKASQLEDLISSTSILGKDDEATRRLLLRIQKDAELYRYFATVTLNSLEAILNSDFVDENEELVLLQAAENKTTISLHELHTDSLESELEENQNSPSLRHTESKESIGTTTTNPIIRSLQNDTLSSIPPEPTSVFKWTVLRSLSSHIHDMIPKFGKITCFDVSFGLAFGTESSTILVYDLSQNLIATVGNVDDAYGSVTCIKFSAKKEYLIAGYSSGYVCIWILKSKTKLHVLKPLDSPKIDNDGHKFGIPIVAVAMTTTDKFYSADAQGAAFFHTIVSRLFYRTVISARIHGRYTISKHTTILSFKPLEKSPNNRMEEDKMHLVAIASPFKIAIFTMKPVPHLCFRVAWAELHPNDLVATKVDHAVLSWRRPQSKTHEGNIRLAIAHGDRIALLHFGSSSNRSNKIKLLTTSIATAKLPFQIVALEWLNSQLIICLSIDHKFSIYDSKNMSFVESGAFSISRYPQLDMVKTYCPSLQNHIISHSNRLFICGDEICFSSLLPWQERLDILAKAGEFQEALRIGADLYHGNSPIASILVPTDRNERIRALGNYLLELTSRLVSSITTGCNRQDIEISNSISLTSSIFSLFLEIDMGSLIFSDIWDKYLTSGLEKVYIEALSDMIIYERLTEVPSNIVKYIFQCLEQNRPKLELVLHHLDLEFLDVNYILTQTQILHLIMAKIYIYNKALKDYTTPILEILRSCKNDNFSELSKQDMYTLFVYISYSLDGRSFPLGLPNPEMAAEICSTVLSFITAKSTTDFEGNYPFIFYLLKADVSQAVKVLLNAMENRLLDKGIPLAGSMVINRRYIVDIVYSLISTNEWDQYHLDHMFSFIAKSYARYSDFVNLNSTELLALVEALLSSTLDHTFEERQTALLSMYTAGFIPFLDNEEYSSRLKSSAFWELFGLVSIKAGNYYSAVESYMETPHRIAKTISEIEQWLAEPDFDEKFKMQIKDALLANVENLARNFGRLAELINENWPEVHQLILDRLRDNPEMRLEYLSGVLEFDLGSIPKDQLYESYVELSLLQNADKGVKYLESFSENELPVSLDFIFNISKKHGINAGTIFAQSRKGNFRDAATQVIDKIKSSISKSGELVQSDVEALIKVCSSPVKRSEKIAIWNFVLESAFLQVVDSQTNPNYIKLRDMLVEAAVKVVSIPNILAILLEINSSSTFGTHKHLMLSLLHKFTQEKETMEHAVRLSKSTIFEAFEILNQSSKSSFYPNPGHCLVCKKLFHLQAMTLLEQKENIIIFKCHHAFHVNCLDSKLEKAHQKLRQPGTFDEYDMWCYTCGTPSTKRNKGKSKMFFPSMPDLTAGTGDSARQLLATFDLINECVYPKTDFISQMKNSQPKTYTQLDHDEIHFNDEDD